MSFMIKIEKKLRVREMTLTVYSESVELEHTLPLAPSSVYICCWKEQQVCRIAEMIY